MQSKYKNTWYCCYRSATIQAVIINLAPLFFAMFSTRFGVSYEKIGRLVLISFLVQLMMDSFALWFVDRWGYRFSFILAHSAVTGGLLLFALLPNIWDNVYAGMVLSAVVYSVGAGILEVLISPITERLPSKRKAASMSLVHSFYCWGQVLVVLLTTVLVHFLGEGYWWLLFVIWSLLPLYNLIRGLRVSFPPTVPTEERTSLRQLLSSPLFWLLLLIMLCGGAAEQIMSQWASAFAEKGLGVSKVEGDLFGPCLFALLMGTGRLLYSRWGKDGSLRPLLIICALLCVVCYAATVFVPIPLLALLGCGLCGLSVSLMWPGTISMSAAYFRGSSTTLFACLALAGDMGCSLGPWLTGMLSDAVRYSSRVTPLLEKTGLTAEQVGLKVGMLSAILFPLVMLLGLWLLPKHPRSDNP